MSDLAIRFEEARNDGKGFIEHVEAIKKQYKMTTKQVVELYIEWLRVQ